MSNKGEKGGKNALIMLLTFLFVNVDRLHFSSQLTIIDAVNAVDIQFYCTFHHAQQKVQT